MTENNETKVPAIVVKAEAVPTFTLQTGTLGKIRDLAGTVETVKVQKAHADTVAGLAMWNGALLAYRLAEVGFGEGKPYAKQGDAAKAMGFVPGYFTHLRNLGEAAERHGVALGSDAWRHLCRRMDKGADAHKAVREAVTGPKAAFRKALTASVKAEAAEAKAPKGKREARPNTKGGGSGTEGKGAEAPKVTKAATKADVLHTLRNVEEWLNAAKVTDAKAVEAAMLKIVKGSRDKREVLARTIKGEAEVKAS